MEWHRSVLVEEVLDGLAMEAGGILADATAGDGGHLEAFCERYGDAIKLIGIDADSAQIERAKERLAGRGCEVVFIESNFRDFDRALASAGYQYVDRVIFDLGWSTPQMEASGRGFSFRRDEPLTMTYASEASEASERGGLTAATIVNSWDEKALQTIIRGYGEERFAGRIARAIAEAREIKAIETTGELEEIIVQVVPVWYRNARLHPATRTFQAIRMAVNDEITALEEGLAKSFEALSPLGRIGVISFHSLEDRVVKRQFRTWSKDKLGTIVTKKPIGPSEAEREENPRARSAKLRIFQKAPSISV
ncbi:MAG: 16S rRNA (cytosine(1402)-N(4))-methyltransferase RsmH [Candidatus Paceibacterota bacterium]